jgi:RNA polymerase sigma factor FliA
MTTSTNQLTPTTRRLVEENLPLVDHITKRVAATFPRHIDREELARAGMLGLVEAAIRFDPERGRFSTFAGRRIEGAILDEVRRRSWVPRSVRSAARWLTQLEEQLVQDLGRRPSETELAGAAGLSVDELARHRSRAVHGYVDTLDRPAGPEGDTTVADLVADATERAPDEQLEDLELTAYLRSAVANLPERHRLVIVGYFIEGRSMEELGRLLGVSQSRVSQLKDFALDLMRGAIESQYREGAAAPPQGRAQRSRAAYAAVVAADAAATRRPAGRSARRHPVAV